jgi:site-specific recombinase XerC
VLSHINGLRQAKNGISAQTFNFYLQAIKQFCRWMVKDRRATENPLLHLQGLNVRTDRRHDRRALSLEELTLLLETATDGPVRFNLAGPERELLYRLAVETGLRAGELRSLSPASFRLSGSEPTTCPALLIPYASL